MLIQQLHARFSLKDLGQLNYFLGVEATYNETSMQLTQQCYIHDLLYRIGMTNCKPISSLVFYTRQLSRFSGVPMTDFLLYRNIIGYTICINIPCSSSGRNTLNAQTVSKIHRKKK